MVYERVGGELYRSKEHDALHPYCKYQHVFILAQSDIDADIGENAETYWNIIIFVNSSSEITLIAGHIMLKV